jgi:hypothetical protein
MRPSEHNADRSDGKLPWWAFPLAAVALVLAPSDRAEGRQLAAKGQDADPAGHQDGRGRAALTPSQGMEGYSLASVPQCFQAPCDCHCSGCDLLCVVGDFSRHCGSGGDIWPGCRPLDHRPASQRSFGRAARRRHRHPRRPAPVVDLAATRQLGFALSVGVAGLALERECWHEGALRRPQCCLW